MSSNFDLTKMSLKYILNHEIPKIVITSPVKSPAQPRQSTAREELEKNHLYLYPPRSLGQPRQSTAREEWETNQLDLYGTTPNAGDPFAVLNALLDGSTLVQKTFIRSPYGPDYPYENREYHDMHGLLYQWYCPDDLVGDAAGEEDAPGEDDASSCSSDSSIEFLFERRAQPSMTEYSFSAEDLSAFDFTSYIGSESPLHLESLTDHQLTASALAELPESPSPSPSLDSFISGSTIYSYIPPTDPSATETPSLDSFNSRSTIDSYASLTGPSATDDETHSSSSESTSPDQAITKKLKFSVLCPGLFEQPEKTPSPAPPGSAIDYFTGKVRKLRVNDTVNRRAGLRKRYEAMVDKPIEEREWGYWEEGDSELELTEWEEANQKSKRTKRRQKELRLEREERAQKDGEPDYRYLDWNLL